MVLSRMKKPEETTGSNQEKLTDSEQIINMVNKAVTSITNRLNNLAHFEGVDSKVSEETFCFMYFLSVFFLKFLYLKTNKLN